ncbi:LysO family transporter [Clostridium sp. DL1XJH146]
MLSIILVLIIGILIGIFTNLKPKSKKILSKLQLIGVLLLVFIMGTSIGANKDILNQIKEIGELSLFFAISTTLFSIIIVFLLTKNISRKGKE